MTLAPHEPIRWMSTPSGSVLHAYSDGIPRCRTRFRAHPAPPWDHTFYGRCHDCCCLLGVPNGIGYPDGYVDPDGLGYRRILAPHEPRWAS